MDQNTQNIDAIIISNLGVGVEKKLKESSINNPELFLPLFAGRCAHFRGNFYTQMELFNLARLEALKITTDPESDQYWSSWKLPSLAGITLLSYLKKNGINAELINNLSAEKKRLAQLIEKKPLAIVISTSFMLKTTDLTNAVSLIRDIDKTTPIIAGGKLVSNKKEILGPQKATQELKKTGANFFIFSKQGEDILAELLQKMQKNHKFDDIPNLAYFETGELKYTHDHTREINIEETQITFDSSLKNYLKDSVMIRTTNGCKFKCAFCTYPETAGKYSSINLDIIKNQLKQIKEIGINNVYFVDDTFNVPLPRFRTLLKMIIDEKFNINWYSFLRAQYIDEETVTLMKQSGCKAVFLGIESSDDEILKNMDKDAKAQDYLKGISFLKKNGIITVGAFIVGFPGETKQSVNNTIQFINNSGLDFYFVQEFYYLHNSPIHRKKEKWNLTGEFLKWKHSTMDSNQAAAHKRDIIKTITNSIYIDPDMTIWQIGYLLGKGISLEDVKKIHKITDQMLILDLKNFSNNNNSEKEQLFEQMKQILANYPASIT